MQLQRWIGGGWLVETEGCGRKCIELFQIDVIDILSTECFCCTTSSCVNNHNLMAPNFKAISKYPK